MEATPMTGRHIACMKNPLSVINRKTEYASV